MKPKFIDYYMKIADLTSQLSYAKRLQVGAVIVKENQIIGTGYNGMPAGWDNNCESKQFAISKDFNGNYFPNTEEEYPFIEYSDEDEAPIGRYKLKTRPEVLHAESNALTKVARSTESSEGATLFCTHAPCIECAKLIYQSGITQVYYKDQYRDTNGITFLKNSGVKVNQT